MRAPTTPFHHIRRLALGLAMLVFATSATAEVVAVVSARSPESTLSHEQLADIFLGRTSRFPDGRPAVPIDQLEGAGARDEFYLRFAGKAPAQVKAYWSKIIFTGRGQPPREVSGDVEVRKRLAENPNAIGYIERNLVDASVKAVSAQ